jgi:hypothetical protein
MGYEQSRRDDVESVMYMLIHFLRGDLPWTGGDERAKATASIEVTCAGLPREFAQMLRDVRLLKFEQRPDYDAYRQTFARLAVNEPFDWEKSGILASLEGEAIQNRPRRLSFPVKLPMLEKHSGSGSGTGLVSARRATNWQPTHQAAVRPAAIRQKIIVPRYSGSLSGGQRK